jgi:arylsulfatase A-like enzyme
MGIIVAALVAPTRTLRSAFYTRWMGCRARITVMCALLASLVITGIARAKPNVLVIVTDDQRANTLGVMPKTRSIFLREGRQYTNAFAVTPLCCPSRASIFTGRFAHNTKVRTNDDARRLDTSTMFPRLLRSAGYESAFVGRFLNGWGGLRRPPPHFDRWARFGGKEAYTNPMVNVNGLIRGVAGYSTDLVGHFAVRFLRRFEAKDARPWLLYVAPHAPHYPWKPAARHASAPVPFWPGNPAVFERDRSDKPAYVLRSRSTVTVGRRVRRGQLRALMAVDDMVGSLFQTLGQLRESGNTLAIYVSDNGYTWAEHRLGRYGTGGGQKRVPYTPSVKVPLLLRWPGHVGPGAKSARLTGTVDLAPTILAAAQVAPDPSKPPLDGRSLLDAGTRRHMLLEYWKDRMRIPTWASLRARTFQYVEYYAADGVTRTSLEFYDLVRDPWQLRNLLGDGNRGNNPKLKTLRRKLVRARACAGTTGAKACP